MVTEAVDNTVDTLVRENTGWLYVGAHNQQPEVRRCDAHTDIIP